MTTTEHPPQQSWLAAPTAARPACTLTLTVTDAELLSIVAIALEGARGRDLLLLTEVLEHAGLTVAPVLLDSGRFNPYRLNVVGDIGAYALARDGVEEGFYGRPISAPNLRYGEAPRGLELAGILLGLRGIG